MVRCEGPLVALHVDAVDRSAGRHEVEGPVLSTFDELMIHVVPTVNMIILLQECMFLVTPHLCDHGKPILMSGVVLQADLVFHCSLKQGLERTGHIDGGAGLSSQARACAGLPCPHRVPHSLQ